MEVNAGPSSLLPFAAASTGTAGAKQSQVCPKCHKEFEDLTLHIRFCSKKKQHICKSCYSMFDSEDLLTQHQITCLDRKLCTTCFQSFTNQSELDAHVAFAHPSVPTLSLPGGDGNPTVNSTTLEDLEKFAANATVSSGKHYLCTVCQEIFTDKSHLSQHSLLHRLPSSPIMAKTSAESSGLGVESPAYGLPYGPIVFPTYPTSKSFDLKITLQEAKVYQCKVCDQKFAQKEELKKHKLVQHSGTFDANAGLEKCEECGQVFAGKKDLARHMTKHDQPKVRLEEKKNSLATAAAADKTQNKKFVLNFDSSVPSSAFQSNNSGNETEGNFRCEICFKAYKRKSSYVMHIKGHETETGHRCTQCGKTFFDKDNLVKHQQTHTRDRPYQCDLCQKSFTQKPVLVEHRRIHTGEKPFKCAVCGKAFSAKVNLTKHLRIHTGEKPFECDVCGKAFTQKSSLWTHRRTHTG